MSIFLISISSLSLSASLAVFLIEFMDVTQGPAGSIEVGKSVDEEIVTANLFPLFIGIEHIADIDPQQKINPQPYNPQLTYLLS